MPDGSADDVNAPTFEADIVGMAPEARKAEILNAAPAVRKWARRMLAKEGPYVEVLYAMNMANEVLRAALAKTQHQEPVPVDFACFRPPREQLSQVIEGYSRKLLKIGCAELLE